MTGTRYFLLGVRREPLDTDGKTKRLSGQAGLETKKAERTGSKITLFTSTKLSSVLHGSSALAVCGTRGRVDVAMLLSRLIPPHPPSPLPRVHTLVLYISASIPGALC